MLLTMADLSSGGKFTILINNGSVLLSPSAPSGPSFEKDEGSSSILQPFTLSALQHLETKI